MLEWFTLQWQSNDNSDNILRRHILSFLYHEIIGYRDAERCHWSVVARWHFLYNEGMSWSWSYDRFTTTCAISSYHNWRFEFEPRSWHRYRVLGARLCVKVCQWLVTRRWFSPGTPVSFTNKTDHHDIIEMSNTIKPTQYIPRCLFGFKTP